MKIKVRAYEGNGVWKWELFTLWERIERGIAWRWMKGEAYLAVGIGCWLYLWVLAQRHLEVALWRLLAAALTLGGGLALLHYVGHGQLLRRSPVNFLEAQFLHLEKQPHATRPNKGLCRTLWAMDAVVAISVLVMMGWTLLQLSQGVASAQAKAGSALPPSQTLNTILLLYAMLATTIGSYNVLSAVCWSVGTRRQLCRLLEMNIAKMLLAFGWRVGNFGMLTPPSPRSTVMRARASKMFDIAIVLLILFGFAIAVLFLMRIS